MNKLVYNKISRDDFFKLDEDNIMFITNPGRMGDEDGSTFIVMDGNEFAIFRVDGWMYPDNDASDIPLNDMMKQFPEWLESWKHGEEKDYQGKYKYIYMGFGNGLSIDNSIYDEYIPYLNDLVNKYLENKDEEEKKSLRYGAIFSVWLDAFINMIKDKKYELKKQLD